MRLALFVPLAIANIVLSASLAPAQSLTADEVLSSFDARPISVPNPVPGADGKTHLAFELAIANPSRVFATLTKVEILDAAGAVLSSAAGDALTAMMTSLSGDPGLIPPGGTGTVFVDVAIPHGAPIPDEITPRISAKRQLPGKDGKPAGLPADSPLPEDYTFTGSAFGVGPAAVVVSPPLKGKGWVAVNGCCDSVTSHRGAVMAVNGVLRVPERFAIDWIKLDDRGRIYVGDGSKLESYPYFGTPVLAAADGVVVNLYDGAAEQVPGKDPSGVTTESIGGNMIVIDIGGGAYAFYAHMQPGSLKVKLGDHVKTGQEIGLLGNTGNTTAPHLHFHVMDGKSPLDANGLPYVFDKYTGEGVLTDDDSLMESGGPAKIDASRLAGPQTNTLPLNNQVVSFD